MERRLGDRRGAEQRVRHVLEQPARLKLRMGRGPRNVEHGRRGHARLGQNLQRRFVVVERLQPVFDQGSHLVAAFQPGVHTRKARVVRQLGLAHRPDERRPLMLHHGKDDVALPGFVHAVGTHVEEVAAEAVRHDRPVRHQEQRKIDVVEIHQRFELGYVDVLSPPARRPMEERGADRQRRVNARVGVAEIVAHVGRRPVGLARHRHDAALRLGDDVEAGVLGVWPVLPVPGDGRHDELRVVLPERIVVELQARHDAGAVVLHHDVGLPHEVIGEVAAARVLEFHADALLAGAGSKIERALAVFE